jgi:hypothetical protein
MISAGDVRTIERSDVNGDHRIDQKDFDQQAEAIRSGDTVSVEGGAAITYEQWQAQKEMLRNSFPPMASNVDPAQAESELGQARTRLGTEYAEYQRLEQQLSTLRSQTPPATEADIQAATRALQQVKENLAEQVRQIRQLNISLGKDKNDRIDTKILELTGMSEGDGTSSATFEMKASTTGGTGGAGTQPGAQGAKAMGFTPPATWGADPFGGTKGFTTDAYMKSTMMEDNILNSFDSVLQNQNKGKQMMMLFFYFARMAESGDLGAMYQFMKFITYIITKDKAKQQIDMGKKLIELQDLSRQWTDKLLNTQTNSTDPNASNEFMKTMTQVKSETDAIATSQKLISQMMEEFSQIVETLTNTTKSALEANGRVLRTVSTIR